MNSFISQTFTPPPTRSTDDKRIVWIDLAKGICITLVVLLHCSERLNSVLGLQLRMPLYFVLSGLFFKDYGGIFNFLKRKINNILIPFLFFYVASSVVLWLLCMALGLEHVPYPDLLFLFKEGEIEFNVPIWFLLCLFWVNILYYFIHSISRFVIVRCLLSLAVGGVEILLGGQQISLPLFVDSALMATPFFFFGTLLRKSFVLRNNNRLWLQAIVSIAVLVVLCVLPYFITPSYYRFKQCELVGNCVIAFLSSCLAVIALLTLCKCIKWLPFFSYFGRYSIIVMCFHYVYLDVFNDFFLGVIPHSVFWGIIVVFLLSWFSIPLSIKYLPYVTAQKDLFCTK